MKNLKEEGSESVVCKAENTRVYDDIIEKLLEGPYLIIDILPEKVPADAGGQYFAVERYFLQPMRIRPLRRKYAEILLRLNCYYKMAVSFGICASWETNPDPESFCERVAELSENDFLRALFANQSIMIDYDCNDTYMTVYGTDPVLLERFKAFASAEGLFVWNLQQKE